jgi:HPt (histidine-containing phosphotransfer) domain-containing protein
MSQLEPIRSEFADDPDFQELIEMFCEGLADRRRELRSAFESGEVDRLRVTAHQLKGSGGGYGFRELSDLARHLEAACKTNAAEIETRLDEILDHVDRILATA